MTDGLLEYERTRVRLRMLEILARQPGASLANGLMRYELKVLGYNKSAEYILNQYSWLETEAGAVQTIPAGKETIAKLTSTGRDHVEGVRVLVGVATPDDA